ncbi:MAG: hypothetical protein CSA35_01115 [Dethiosulfovibrio peptidovorans]|nr:MAG: hypothetical protein CSA35_01115 [Dethiosulfovibrio peptidovorans]
MRLLRTLENVLCAVGLVFCTFATIFQILNRYWLHIEIIWIGEFLSYVFFITVLLSIVITTREGSHTSVDILPGIFSERNKTPGKFLDFFIEVISLIVLIFLLSIFSKYALKAYRYPEWGALCSWFNASWLIEGLFFMFLISALHLAVNCWQAACSIRFRGKEKV